METKEKIRKGNLGNKLTDEQKKRHSESLKGRKFSNEHKKNLSNSLKDKNKGKKRTKEQRKIMSEINTGKGNPFYGKKHTEETKQKLRDARLSQKFDKNTTKPERFIRSILTLNGVKYEVNKPITGIAEPDIFIKPNICIFVDGCYWHGCIKCGYNNKEKNLKDKNVDKKLRLKNYKVIRIWEHDIYRNINKCVKNLIGL